MITKRNIFLFFVFSALLVLNLLQWLKEGDSAATELKTVVFDRGKLVLKVSYLEMDKERNISRNLFHEELNGENQALSQRGKKTLKSIQVKKMTVRRDMSSYVLVGILVRDGKKEGFITKGGENYQVSIGDKVNNRYLVKSISEESIRLFDPVYQISKELQLSSGM